MNYFTLTQQIKKKELAPLYLFCGTEEFLLDESLKQLRQEIVGEDAQAFNYQILEEERNSLPQLIEAVSTLPFLGGKRLVIFKAVKLFSGEKKDGEQLFLRSLENLPEFTHLVVVSPQVDKRKKIYQTFLQKGEIVEFAPLKPWELEKFLLERVGLLGKGLDREAMSYLLEVVGKDLRLLTNELEKTALYVGDQEVITKKDLEEILSKQGEQNIFRFLDALGQRKSEQALLLLQQLLKLGEPPVKVVYMLTQQFRLVWQVKTLAEKGYDKSSIAAKLQQRSLYAVEKALAKSQNFTWMQLEDILKQLLEVDRKLKSSSENPKLALEILILFICQTK